MHRLTYHIALETDAFGKILALHVRTTRFGIGQTFLPTAIGTTQETFSQ